MDEIHFKIMVRVKLGVQDGKNVQIFHRFAYLVSRSEWVDRAQELGELLCLALKVRF